MSIRAYFRVGKKKETWEDNLFFMEELRSNKSFRDVLTTY